MSRAGILTAALAVAVLASGTLAAGPIEPQQPPPTPSFNRLYDVDAMGELLQGYAAAYPRWMKVESIGKSLEGRDLWLVTITNPATGPASSKPALYADANTHANEVQGAEVLLYVIDLVLKRYGELPRVTELLDRATLYLVPVVNPDGRALWFEGPSNADFPRTVMRPIDDDRDGLVDEDPFDDLDGDGIITTMRKKVPMGQGTHRQHPKDPRLLVPVEPDELGDWIVLGAEGIDNDGDGAINEDPVGYVDPNRTWGYDWQPPYVQAGAGPYPLSIPETRSIAVWADAQPNLAAVQSFHNYGQMILRDPSSKEQPRVTPQDLRVYDLLGAEGEKLIPGYRYLVVWKDLYTAYGGTTSHFYRLHGAIGFTMEMYQPPTDLDDDETISDEETMVFNDRLTLGRQFVAWKPIGHPLFGEIEVGGFRHDVGRVPESWLIEEETHRAAAFLLFHAHHLPKIRFGEPEIEKLDGGLWRLRLPVTNERAIPTMTAVAVQNRLFRPDLATVDGAEVIASGVFDDPWAQKITLQEHRPGRLLVDGVPGMSTRHLFFLLEGRGEVTVRYDSLKAGTIERRLRLAED